MKKYLKFIICCVIISTAMYHCDKEPKEEPIVKKIEITGDMSFGKVDVGTKSTKTLVINNTSNSTVNVDDISCPADFYVDWSKGSIASGKQKEITVTFAPTEVKAYTGEILISSDAVSERNKIQVSGVGNERQPVLVVTPSNIDFGELFIGETKTLTLKISNIGKEAIYVTGKLPANTPFKASYLFDTNIPANSSYDVNVEFSPLTSESCSAEYRIHSSLDNVIIPLKGKGLNAFTLSSKNISFEGTNILTGKMQSFKISNKSNNSLTIKKISSDNENFQLLWNDISIAAGESLPVTVLFKPVEHKTHSGLICVETSAGKDTIQITGTTKDELDIHVCGDEADKSARAVPTYWKNGKPVRLAMSSNSALPRSIAISGLNYHIVGKQINLTNNLEPMYWNNTTALRLIVGNTYNYGEAYSVAVKNSNVYIAGYLASLGGINVNAVYWKNNEPIYLTNEGYKSQVAYGIAISNYDDVYVCGKIGNAAVYWINGNVRYLTDGNRKAEARKIALFGSDVYIVGYETNSSGKLVAKYWKNGVAYNLSDGTRDAVAEAIFVEKNNVHIVGTEVNTSNVANAKYWKNGQTIPLQLGSLKSQAAGISVVDGDVFIAGYENTTILGFPVPVAKYWFNGIPINLIESGGQAMDIVVLKK